MPRRKQTNPSRHGFDTKDNGVCSRRLIIPRFYINSSDDGDEQGSSQNSALDLSISRQGNDARTMSCFSVDRLLRTDAGRTGSLLDQLSTLVTKVGGENVPIQETSTIVESTPDTAIVPVQDLWGKYVKKEESAELRRINEAKQIFTCLQCRQSFQTMDQLVKHMELTQHFTNVPKHYSWSLQYARQKMRQMKLKLKYSKRMAYLCQLCSTTFAIPVHQHFADEHNLYNPVENMSYVQLIGNCKTEDVRSATPSESERSTSPSLPRSFSVKFEPKVASTTLNLLSKMETLVQNAKNESSKKRTGQSYTHGKKRRISRL